jgi:hypothetical protein
MGEAKCSSTIPFEIKAEESRNFMLRMIERFKTKASMTTKDGQTEAERKRFVNDVEAYYFYLRICSFSCSILSPLGVAVYLSKGR